MPDYNQYISTGTSTTTAAENYLRFVELDAVASINAGPIQGKIQVKPGISPIMYFKYVKSKFGMLEKVRLDARLKRLEKAFNEAVENGQEILGEKFMNEMAIQARESVMYAKGVRNFVEYEDVQKFKRKIRGGHISDTMLGAYTRIIPEKVLKKLKNVKAIFDDFVIYHYWDEKAEENRSKKQKFTPDEKEKMKDPILFGIIKENNRLYFIDDWDDEFCDLTFDEMIDVLGKDDEEMTINRNPKLHENAI
jgi:hypothetical protein